MKNGIRHISLIGSGRVAHFFGKVFRTYGFKINYVVSRNEVTGKELASELHAEFSKDIRACFESDLILLAVKDDAIQELGVMLKGCKAIVAHTAGAVAMDVLEGIENRAVIYPLQTINSNLNAYDAPILLECSNEKTRVLLETFLKECVFQSGMVDSDQRLCYHLAAVFANNFTNAMLAASEQIVKENHLHPVLLTMLIRQTFINAINNGAMNSQTGPALREDFITMNKHLELLKNNEDLTRIYKLVSEFISKQGKQN